MTQDGIRTRRNFPAETWAVVRDAYLGGETADSIARRLNLSENTIRKRASRCGWTHSAHKKALARAGEGEPVWLDDGQDLSPQQALERATLQAARWLAQGRGAEATALIRAAQGLSALIEAAPALAASAGTTAPDPPPLDEAEVRTYREGLLKSIMAEAERLAARMLGDAVTASLALGSFAYHWRALNLGPACAAADHAQAVANGCAERYWDADGRLLPMNTAFDQQWTYDRTRFGFPVADDDPDRML